MATISIRMLPDPVLRQKSKRVAIIDKSIKKLINSMMETLQAAPGVGLAAPQIGVLLRVIVVGMPEQEAFSLINPQVVRRKGERLVDEGCLSIPGYVGQITRSESVTVKGMDTGGKEVRVKAEGLLAQVLEHEMDHLNGVLYIDHLESPDKLHKLEPKSEGGL